MGWVGVGPAGVESEGGASSQLGLVERSQPRVQVALCGWAGPGAQRPSEWQGVSRDPPAGCAAGKVPRDR